MYQFSVPFTDHLSSLYWTAMSWPARIIVELNNAKTRLSLSRQNIVAQLSIDKHHVTESIKAYEQELKSYKIFSIKSNVEDVLKQIKSLRGRINKIMSLIDYINFRENLIGENKFVIESKQEFLALFEIYETLWTTVESMGSTIAKWMNLFFMDLNAETIVEQLDYWKSTFRKLLPLVSFNKNAEAVIIKMISEHDHFARYTNVLVALLNPGM